MLEAIIFDFDGVIVDTEPAILGVFQELAQREGLTLTEEDYFADYLALHDRDLIRRLFHAQGHRLSEERFKELLAWKSRRYREVIQDGLPPLPGAVEFIGRVGPRFPLAIATGSIRPEVVHLLDKLNLTEKFPVLVSADEFGPSKPDPECFRMALERLRKQPSGAALQAGDCLVIEDSPAGLEGAHRAGMKCLGLAHSRPLEELAEADWRAQGYGEIHWEDILAAFSGSL